MCWEGLRDVVVDFLRSLQQRTELPWMRLVSWLGIARAKFYEWRDRYGTVHEHNAWIPRDHWLLPRRNRPSSISTRNIRWRDIDA